MPTNTTAHAPLRAAMQNDIPPPRKGRVYGTDGLRVCDASIFPSITSGNLNAPTIMVAERISDMIVNRGALLADADAAYHVPSNWETSQR